MPRALSPWAAHVAAWGNCQRCLLAARRTHICLARGDVPCDVLFVGEAPGPSENLIGQPFKGPAGHLLDQIIQRAGLPERGLKWVMSNLVACIPLDDAGDKFEEPDDESVEACAPRLQQLVKICDPQLIVTVGALARDWLDTKWKKSIRFHRPIPQVNITHPAALLRMNDAQKGLAVQKCVVVLANAVEEFCSKEVVP